jgi:demethylmenaquinone methyltransferase/2-methoxy-6-polyprenyl-1,4-benzoquinol methylase
MTIFLTMPTLDVEPDIASVNRSKAQARCFYNSISTYYDTLAASSERKYIKTGLEMLAVQEGEHVLEIGCGTGHALVQIAQSTGKSGHVYGIDISEGMIQISRERLCDHGLSKRVSLVLDDASNLPFSTGSVETIFISFTLELFHTKEIDQVLAECHRILKQQGRISIVSLAKDEPLNFFGRLYEWLHNKFPKALDCRPIPVQALLHQADFTIKDHQKETMWGLPVSMTLASAVK